MLQPSIQQSKPSLQSKLVSLPKDDRDHLEIPLAENYHSPSSLHNGEGLIYKAKKG